MIYRVALGRAHHIMDMQELEHPFCGPMYIYAFDNGNVPNWKNEKNKKEKENAKNEKKKRDRYVKADDRLA